MDKKHFLDDKKRIHFMGIGGSGMCPLAEILLAKTFGSLIKFFGFISIISCVSIK